MLSPEIVTQTVVSFCAAHGFAQKVLYAMEDVSRKGAEAQSAAAV
jgi:hypothetical protein